ncbi:hypothetical protein HYH03_000799 [Edaphochlamys debaryana]|uniref:Uncharacterized protein n=1 Tax=Edaphochlamys debaryana TaxID=47281 RepID=A0A835YFV8_9CHLO|nr:hypothetical protein HYH03_000799 [Edaphochlamys debaryana]|eukprot:KAG2500977.1 hypothetical protein HYH03_000799 [Edaphochlamys debaryana]
MGGPLDEVSVWGGPHITLVCANFVVSISRVVPVRDVPVLAAVGALLEASSGICTGMHDEEVEQQGRAFMGPWLLGMRSWARGVLAAVGWLEWLRWNPVPPPQ